MPPSACFEVSAEANLVASAVLVAQFDSSVW